MHTAFDVSNGAGHLFSSSLLTRVLMVVDFENKDFFYFLEWTYSVTGIEGNLVELPCNLSTIKSEDGVKLVLWFKNGSNRPIYT